MKKFITKLPNKNILSLDIIEKEIGHDEIVIKTTDKYCMSYSTVIITPTIEKGNDKDVVVRLHIEIKPPIRRIYYKEGE